MKAEVQMVKKARAIDLEPGTKVLTPTGRAAIVITCGGDRPTLRYLDGTGGSVVLLAELLRLAPNPEDAR